MKASLQGQAFKGNNIGREDSNNLDQEEDKKETLGSYVTVSQTIMFRIPVG